MSNQYQPPSMNGASGSVRSIVSASSDSTLIVSTGWLCPRAVERYRMTLDSPASADAQGHRVHRGPAAPVAGRERVEVGGERDPAPGGDQRAAPGPDLLGQVRGHVGAEADARLGLAGRGAGGRGAAGHLAPGELLRGHLGRELGGAAVHLGLHVQRDHVEVVAGEHDPLHDTQAAPAARYRPRTALFSSTVRPPRRSAVLPAAKCGRIRLSYMLSADPMAMCMSRYLYVPRRPPNSTPVSRAAMLPVGQQPCPVLRRC